MKYFNPKIAPYFLIVILCFLSRLPQLISPYLFLDPDECVVGLMAKHMLNGRDLPLFFWGQQYGFSLVECFILVSFYAVLGISTIATKLAMLSLWTTGVIFLYKTLCLLNRTSKWIPFLLILCFISHPAWAIWSMKARGGYITAFTLSNIALYLSLRNTEKNKLYTSAALSVLIALIFQSQAFWLAGIVPVILYRLWIDKDWKGVTLVTLVFAVITYAFHVYKATIITAFQPALHLPDTAHAWIYIKRIPEYLYSSLHGTYYFSFIQKPNFLCALLAIIGCVIIFTLPLAGIVYFMLARKQSRLLFTTTLFIIPCLCATLLSDSMEARYLLPLTGYALLPLQLLLNKTRLNKILTGSMITISLTGMVALITFWNFEFSYKRKDTILRSVQYLKRHQARYVFCADIMLVWHINFYSNETITARMPIIPERYSANGDAVNNALNTNQRTAALIFRDQDLKIRLQNREYLNEFVIGLYPSKAELSNFFSFPGE